MATKKSCFWYVFILQGTLFFDCSAFANERATRDLRCPQKQVTTSTGEQATLGCYTTQANSSWLKYSWKKDNVTVTSSSHITVYANMLFVTPENDTDFGTYECHDGVSNTSCSISLRSRQESEGYTNVVTGCVNLAVLMPVLAVMMVSLLLNVHFLIQWRRRQRFLLSEEEIYQLHLAREDIAVNHEDKEEENVEVKKKKFFGGRFKNCKKEGDKREKDRHENIQDSSNLDKDKGEEIEMQESKDFLNTQDGSRGLDIPREQDSSWKKKRPWEHYDDVTRADDNQEILRLDDILRVQETSTPVQDSMNEWESPRSIDSAGTKGIPRLEDILREQDSSLPTQDHSHELDSPRTQESPRTKEIPRLQEIFSASEGEAKENVHDETRANVSGAHRSRSGSLQAPRIAEFFLPSDESDAERQSVTSEEPLVSHYMEKMDFEKENDDEHGEEPVVSHYMEKMDFEKGNEDNVQDQEPLVSYYKEKMDFEESKNDEEPVLK